MICPVCGKSATVIHPQGMDGRVVECTDCGTFEICGTALALFEQIDRRNRRVELDNAMARAQLGERPLILPPGYPLAVENADTTNQHVK